MQELVAGILKAFAQIFGTFGYVVILGAAVTLVGVYLSARRDATKD